MKKTPWTQAQTLAIETVGRNVLVTASAGTGKTAVLSERCVRRICDGRKPVDVDQLLVLTFTDAAAEEMKGRIAEKLYAICLDNPDNRHLRKQLVRLDAAWIGTIHSFCKRVLTEHFYLAGLDPRFGILDPDQRKLIQADAMTAVIETAWQDAALAGRMRSLFEGRPIRGRRSTFPDTLLHLAAFLDSVPDREAFYQSAITLAQDNPQARDVLSELHFDYLRQQLRLCRDKATYARHLDRVIAGGQYLSDYIDGILNTIAQCLEAVREKQLSAVSNIIQNWDFPRLPALGKKMEVDKSQAERIKKLVEQVRKQIEGWKDFVLFRPDIFQQIIGVQQEQVQTLILLLRRLDEQYSNMKSDLNVLDFADLEHRALAMFQTQPTVAEKMRRRFEYVFVDEYQDINETQQRILQAVSRPDNLFVVGDVKQSIYAFRQSRPEIFLNSLSAATEDTKSLTLALRVDMNDNFRSRREILDFVNHIFGRIMTPSMGGLDYLGRAQLAAGLDYPPLSGVSPAAQKAVEIYILDEQSEDDWQNGDNQDDGNGNTPPQFSPDSSITAVGRQAAFIARRIRRMVEDAEFEVMDKAANTMRPVEYRDIVILMRALSYRAAEYVELLRLAGIPVSSQSPCGYFAATEVMDFLSLLRVLDNPLQDIELAAVLRSALFRFSDSELATIRVFADRKKTKCPAFFEAVSLYADCGPDNTLRQKAAGALSAIEQWRIESRRKPLSEVIWEIFEEYGLTAFVSALPNGPQRRANLLKFHQRAVQFESFAGVSAGRNLAAFVDFLEKMLEEEFDWAPAQPENGCENAVRVMSVHKSKGLEFPVVFVAELNRPFNKSQNYSSCQINSTMLGLDLPDLPHGVRVPTPAFQIIGQSEKESALAEEMRILYVAMTRARDRLVLTASQKADNCLQRLALLPETSALPDWILRDADSHFNWLLAALAGSEALRGALGSEKEEIFKDDLFVVSRIGKSGLDKLTEQIRNRKRQLEKIYQPVEEQCSNPAAQSLFKQIRSALKWRYCREALTTLNAKFSVSALTHRDDEFARYADFSVSEGESFAAKQADPLSAGSAVHLVFQHLPLKLPLDERTVRQTIAELMQEKQISRQAAEQIDIEAIESFFRTDIGRQVLAHPEKVMREWPFTIALAVNELGIDCPDESVVVQGIVDLIVPVDKGMIVVDFKTDKISADGIERRAKFYQTQLGLYVRAIRSILQTPVVGAYLYFLNPRNLYPIAISGISLKTPHLSDSLI